MLTFWYYFAVFPRRISVVEREPHTCRVRLLAKAFGVAQQRRAFTLLEMLVVMGIIAILMVLVAPAFTTIKGGTDVTSAAYTIKGLLDTARTYAKANNTYTWVGFFEEDGSIPSASPTATPGNGRIVISTVASKDGTEVYTSVLSPPADIDAGGTRLSQIGKLVK